MQGFNEKPESQVAARSELVNSGWRHAASSLGGLKLTSPQLSSTEKQGVAPVGDHTSQANKTCTGGMQCNMAQAHSQPDAQSTGLDA
jgi:hypothetical protein